MKRVLLVSISLFAPAVSAQFSTLEGSGPIMTPELLPIWQKHAVLVDGATNPAGIPYGHAMERVFFDLAPLAQEDEERFRQHLAQLVPATTADTEKLRQIALKSASVAGRIRDEASVRTDDVCADLVASEPGTANAVEYAQRFAAIEANEAAGLTEFYREAVATLELGTRTALEAQVDANVRREMSWGHDLVGLANEVPDAFLAHRTQVCERLLKMNPDEKRWTYNTEIVYLAPSN